MRGHSLIDGYYKDPEKTAEAIDVEKWLRTGDLYSRSEKGDLTFRGRLKDMFKVGGENVSAIEVEAFLAKPPTVKVAEVVGRPDTRLDEVPVVFVGLKRGMSADAEEIIAFCRGQIASYKVPGAVYFKSQQEWPKSLQKVNKGVLRTEALALQMKENQ